MGHRGGAGASGDDLVGQVDYISVLNFRLNCLSPSHIKKNCFSGFAYCACISWLSLSQPRKSYLASSLHPRSIPFFGRAAARSAPNLNRPWPPCRPGSGIRDSPVANSGWQAAWLAAQSCAGEQRGPGRYRHRTPCDSSFCTSSGGPSAHSQGPGPDNEPRSPALVRAPKGPQPLERSLVLSGLQASPGGEVLTPPWRSLFALSSQLGQPPSLKLLKRREVGGRGGKKDKLHFVRGLGVNTYGHVMGKDTAED